MRREGVDGRREASLLEVDSLIDTLLASIGTGREALLPLLQGLQARYRYLPEPALRRICAATDITPAQMEGVIGFYDDFRREPAGEHTVRVCIGTACHVKGAGVVFEAFRRQLGLSRGEDTDAAGLFTLEKVACLGCCMLAPVVQIDDTIYGYLSAGRVAAMMKDFLAVETSPPVEEERARPGAGGEVRICLCSSCRAGGAAAVYRALREETEAGGLPVRLTEVGCTGVSTEAPLVEVRVRGGRRFRYGRVRPEFVPEILGRHFRSPRIGYRIRNNLFAAMERAEEIFSSAFIGPSAKKPDPLIRYSSGIRQPVQGPPTGGLADSRLTAAVATEHAGEMDPLDLEAYRRNGGFAALERCLREISPERVVREIEASGLRGRGGGGFPVWEKWNGVRESGGERRAVICNGDEGDPGAFMDRMLLESFPFRVVEGLLIAAYAVEATEGYLYIRGEYPLALRRIRAAVEMCAGRPGLGGRSLPLRVVEGAGAFVCGEETALIAAMEGGRGMPRVRPPYPSEVGLRGMPTLVNNVETFALVPWILREGAEAFRRYGTERSTGTKTLALAGKVRRGGLFEVPMGTTLREIVEGIGGGVPGGRRLKAIQIGGPSGGCVPASRIDTPVDFEALAENGTMMGSGGIIVLDDTDCMVDIARYFLSFTQQESCGKCTFCRIGTKRMVEIMDRLCSGEAAAGDLRRLEDLAYLVRRGSLCGLGRSSANPVLSTLNAFREEYEAHLRGRCPAGRCAALIRYSIGEECIGCTRCARSCPVAAITGLPHGRHEIDEGRCIRCDSCRRVCPVGAVRID